MPEGLTPAEQDFYKKYGKVPPKKKGPVIKNSGKVLPSPWLPLPLPSIPISYYFLYKHFDSADWSLKQQGGAAGPATGTGPVKGKMVPRAPGASPTAEEPAGEQ